MAGPGRLAGLFQRRQEGIRSTGGGEVLQGSGQARFARGFTIGVLLIVIVSVLGFGVDQVVSSPALCGSCHEMGSRASAWAVSPHAKVKCVSCHVSSHPWYAFPVTTLSRGAFLGRKVAEHFTGREETPADSRVTGASMPDSVCLSCHDPNRQPTAGLGILIDHAKHAKRNRACISCHITVAHPTPSRGTALSFMGQCYTCHGNAKYPKASARCTVCHPADFALLPNSHKAAAWKTGHGKVKESDPTQCLMCHKQSFCDGCHGLKMPHPTDWVSKTGHPAAAARNRAVCSRCHGDQPDMCTVCHHKAYEPSRGTWVAQHFNEVKRSGASACLECHAPVFCARCHIGDSGTPAP
jgi:nitrate/TMAO reductase-like tetraheme cytochrome c subunit